MALPASSLLAYTYYPFSWNRKIGYGSLIIECRFPLEACLLFHSCRDEIGHWYLHFIVMLLILKRVSLLNCMANPMQVLSFHAMLPTWTHVYALTEISGGVVSRWNRSLVWIPCWIQCQAPPNSQSYLQLCLSIPVPTYFPKCEAHGGLESSLPVRLLPHRYSNSPPTYK